ncbi:MAG: peroxidase family protein [Acidimicrobiales bacterium]
MGLGRTWSEGHGREFAVLSTAFKAAEGPTIEAFRRELAAGAPIMVARKVLHGELGPFTRTNSFGVVLDPWDPDVTQFRWYDPRARFWLPSQSKPHQIDAVMRRALLAACDLWRQGYTDIQFCGVCEQEEFKIRYNTVDSSGVKQAQFWVEVPDHWASYDVTGRDGDDRDVRLFLTDWGVGDRPAGDAVEQPGVKGGELRKGAPFDPADLKEGPVEYTLIAWDAEAEPGITPQGIEDLPVPDSERRRIERMERLATTATWTVAPEGAAGPAAARAAAALPAASGAALHGSPVAALPVEGAPISGGGLGRYGRMLAEGPPPTDELLAEVGPIARRMTSGEPGAIPTQGYSDAGYGFLGQFIDHDVTFDSSSSLQRALDPLSLVDFRTPRLDLDALYGGGPAQQPYLYDEMGRFVLGADISYDGRYRPDLARTERGVALIADPRNDQNAIVSQLTVLFLRLHNAVIDGLVPPGVPVSFAEAQREVRWRYQWLLVHHFLPAVIGPAKTASYLWRDGDAPPTGPELAAALSGGRLKLSVVGDPWEMFMPVEFSAAAFRFGHSMLLSSYRTSDGGPAIPTVSRSGLLRRPSAAVDWRYFVGGLGDRKRLQASAAIDTHLLPELGDVDRVGLIPPPGADPVSLPERTLLRGLRLHLPTGQAAVAGLNDRGYRTQALDPAEIGLDDMRSAEETPLWYYILREAELTRGGATLGPVGGTLVAEVLLGLLVHDESSFLHAGWTPPGGDFTFADLVRGAETWAAG